MLKQYYHSINPTESQLSGYDEENRRSPSVQKLSQKALKDLQPKIQESKQKLSLAGSVRGLKTDQSKASFRPD